ncbi:hypothetical protein LINGRAHAP2_LOCUS18191 [Linum grandiflorum]
MSLVKVGLLSMEIPAHIGGDHPKLVLWVGVSNGITVAVLPLKESNHELSLYLLVPGSTHW